MRFSTNTSVEGRVACRIKRLQLLWLMPSQHLTKSGSCSMYSERSPTHELSARRVQVDLFASSNDGGSGAHNQQFPQSRVQHISQV